MQAVPLILVLALASPLAAQQSPVSDGITTDMGVGTRSVPNYPGLPPGTDDLAYDNGIFSRNSRNLQNPDLSPGWPYWAHQVRFTPEPHMLGQLMEVRYVAAKQWGAFANFDLYIRDAAGVEVASLLNQTAVIDIGNWQIVDVSSLNFTPGTSDFYIELRPVGTCMGKNGFTIAFSTIGSNRSAFSSDCANPFASYSPEQRDLFLRAVIATAPPGPMLTVSNLVAGLAAQVSISGATPGGVVRLGYSLAGGGPITTPYGDLLLSSPYTEIPSLTADSAGEAEVSVPVPAGSTGAHVWGHAFDVATLTFTNGFSGVIG